jgi:hypothetical protein
MADRYWVGGTGTWNTSSTTNWSATSGGGTGASVPTSSDAVIFNELSGSGTVTLTGALNCLSLTTAGSSFTFSSTGTLGVSGNFTLSATTVWSATGTITIIGTSTITTDGVVISAGIFINGGITVTLGSALTLGTTATFNLFSGSINLNNLTLSCGQFSSASGFVCGILFGTGNITTTGSGAVWDTGNSNGLLWTGTPTVNISNNSATAATIDSRGLYTLFVGQLTFNFNITTGTYPLTIVNNNRFTSLNFTGFAGTWAPGASSFTFLGNITLVPGMTFTAGTGTWTFSNSAGPAVITSAGKTLGSLAFFGTNNTVQLADNLTVTSTASITLTNGTFDANNQNVTGGQFVSSGASNRTLTMGSGTWTLNGTGTVWDTGTTTNLTFNRNTSNIVLSNTSTTARTFTGGGLTYNKLTIGGATGTSTLTINGTNTFSELASTKTVAHTITFGANQTITTWSVSGSAGNLVTLNSSTSGTLTFAPRTLTIANRTVGIDYLDVTDITGPLAPVIFYAGANSQIRSGVLGVAAVAPIATRFIYVLTSGTSFTVPANWTNSNNEIHLFGGGGGGSTGRASGAGGSGGGGGGYTRLINQSLSGTVSYAIGAASAFSSGDGLAGGTTTWNAGLHTAGGGSGGTSTASTSVGGAGGIGSTANGGAGGAGSLVSTSANGGGGGGGAGGPNGNGGAGGNGVAGTVVANVAGGGGGGNGGGGAGGNASTATGGTGGNNAAGAGGGASNTTGFNGGGAGGRPGSANTLNGGGGTDIASAGMGGAGGTGGSGTGDSTVDPSRAYFGSGGTGGGLSTSNTPRAGGQGSQGGIVIVYTLPPPQAVTPFVNQISGNGSKTIGCFVKTNSVSRMGIAGTKQVVGNTGWVFCVNRTTSGNLTYFHTGSTLEVAAGIVTGTWCYVCATYDVTTATATLYVNGSVIGSPATSFSPIVTSTFNGVVAAEDDANTNLFNGNIAQLSIYNRALSAAEILQNFTALRGRFGI